MRRWLALAILSLIFVFQNNTLAASHKLETYHGVCVGMSEQKFYKKYPSDKIRSFRQEGPDHWLSYNEPLKGTAEQVVTFYFQKDRLVSWKLNDRAEIIKEYLEEFCSIDQNSIIHKAIVNVMLKMPYKDFLYITNRERPIILIDYYDSGTARFASSQEFIVSASEPPCCQGGFTIIKLGHGLGIATTPEAIEGVVAHEIAHRVLEHIKKGNVSCDAERASNRLIKQWGFIKEFEEAKKIFGTRKGDPAGCQEAPAKK